MSHADPALSASPPPATPPSAPATPWEDVRRIYRQICVLREQGRTGEAAALERAEFSRALAAARTAAKSGDDEARLLAAEAERVSAACLLAELVAPMIAERLHANWPPSDSAPVASRRPRPARAPSPSRPAPAGPPSVADLLDGMLALESAAAASR